MQNKTGDDATRVTCVILLDVCDLHQNSIQPHCFKCSTCHVVVGKMLPENEDKIKRFCNVLSQESRELYLTKKVSEVERSISPLIFHREYVSKNLPLLIRGGVSQWPAIGKWNIPYFRETLGDKIVSVAVTPNGYADAIAVKELEDGTGKKEYFVMPEERLVPMSTFLDALESPTQGNVYYIQKQNSNFNEDFPELWSDAGTDISWATETFGKNPDAVNFWMGDQRAVTSMHKDPYENIYCVIAGEKEFVLHPPTDLPWIPYKNYPPANYREIKPGEWLIDPIITESTIDEFLEERNDFQLDFNVIPWISIDPLNPDYMRYPAYKNANTLRVTVCEGDVLYLPSLWFHHVTQSHACIAVNYWYDMEYDIKYAYYKALEALCK
ncbi:bifunctional peptidase and (3S)-lysyl hydroxylase JMJD7 isoform X2 [Neodiprion pinetum]|uniref:bifunctional peptidase and (3S)-lysyl hydroxylase JMJD7 isoform X2 n=1 Tax=Neodiprion pinetum TaxID=441929 RepID=UPI001EDEF721|nr:bifunctional peptidase and (3S)-lysyl hydroxylase JMJD7 [Neodiprion pinetum]